MTVRIKSIETGKVYELKRLISYDIDNTIDIPADHFNITFSNINGTYNDTFRYGDTIEIIENNIMILQGIIDEVKKSNSTDGHIISIDGRDTTLLLLDNDAIPQTYNNITLDQFIRKLAAPYGFTQYDIASTKAITKIVVDTSMSEWDVIQREAFDNLGYWPWINSDKTIVCRPFDKNQNVSYVLSNEMKSTYRYESLEIIENGSDIKSEIWAKSSGTTYRVNKTNEDLIKRGFKRRRILTDLDGSNIEEINKAVDFSLRNSKRGSCEINMVIKADFTIQLDKIAEIHDKAIGIDGKFFVMGVNHSKSSSGTRTKLRFWPLDDIY